MMTMGFGSCILAFSLLVPIMMRGCTPGDNGCNMPHPEQSVSIGLYVSADAHGPFLQTLP